MTPTIASTLAALSNVGKTTVALRVAGTVYPSEVLRSAITRRNHVLGLDSGGSLIIHSGPDAWGALRDFGHEVLEAAVQAE
jgi:hypothetical protein